MRGCAASSSNPPQESPPCDAALAEVVRGALFYEAPRHHMEGLVMVLLPVGDLGA